MQKKIYIFIFSIIIIFVIFSVRVIDLSYAKHDYYLERYNSLKEQFIKGNSAPRGRILDINGKVLVDNIGINTIVYHKTYNSNFESELEIAKKLVEITNYKYLYNESKLKDFYILLKEELVNDLITEEEYKLYNERKLTNKEIYNLKKKRITLEMLNGLTELEKYCSYFYYLMNEGYSFANKILLKDVSDEVYAKILEANLEGIFGEIEWERYYIYGNTLSSIFGTISNSLPKEKEYLLSEGYSYNDKVGISGIEEYYEEYLKGDKALYKIENNNLKLISAAKRGNDLVLNIDIDLQIKVENIIKKEIEKAKKQANTEYYRESYVLISDPNTGNIKSIAGIRRLDNGEYQDVSINVIKNAYTVGSTIKGASITVGYQNKVIDIGSSYNDSCVKLANLPYKCSYKKLGYLNDINALALSSNYYQFMIAIGITKNKYIYNMKLDVTDEHFNIFRNTFKEYGLGTKTYIDLPNESIGLIGSTIAPDLLLNLSIGQYDLYTPVGLLQYINTIASNGARLKLNLMHSIKKGNEIIELNDVQELNKVNLDNKYMDRIKLGFKKVMENGTGYYYTNGAVSSAGKTGTSESYIDTNYDGKLDTFVLSNSFIMYAPYDDPKYSIVVISPNTSDLDSKSTYRSPVNRVIARNINDLVFSSF